MKHTTNIYWLCDCSASMDGEKIESLNFSIPETAAQIEALQVEFRTKVIRFSDRADWHIEQPIGMDTLRREWNRMYRLRSDRRVDADIVFLIDTSHTMGWIIDALKSKCLEFAAKFEKHGFNVRLGLVGFALGGRSQKKNLSCKVEKLPGAAGYTVGIWPLLSPNDFSKQIEELKVGLFGSQGCFVANHNTVPVFRRVIELFDASSSARRFLILISDELGSNEGCIEIVNILRDHNVIAHVIGVLNREGKGAHWHIASETGGKFLSINAPEWSDMKPDDIVTVAGDALAEELDGGTNIGDAIDLLAKEFEKLNKGAFSLPPSIVLVSDGKASNDIGEQLRRFEKSFWGGRAFRMAIAIGDMCDRDMLHAFVSAKDIINKEDLILSTARPEDVANILREIYSACSGPQKLDSREREN